ncbi:hypothetical protein A3B60_02080 [Candidatus Peregrinibacteria bacterium RIFCSPLOWO2_01_FULL_39_12]|nr:MAG: hypothetical protein A3B60_02080 [Candidatus Peregrinibacteria bacterium RIFCSPLOWO2_01_FULL_39_12]OGJ43521.1 MAG: hypothetical protein A3I58_03215 [Candidatus Peregrinibacteria bacterium RIFCSPLOWO2_02_FULL_39_10]
MKKILITITALVIFIILIVYTGSREEKAADISKQYNNDKFGITLDYPETFTVEETENSLTIYHFKEQPVPYFVVNFSEKTTDTLISELKEKVISRDTTEFNDEDAIKVTIFNKELEKNVDFFYIEKSGKTFWFSCFDGLYEEICNSIEFEN